MIDHTGCAGVMIGRAAIDNPWIFAGLDREQVGHPQVRELMLRHLERNLEFYGPQRGLVLFRKHAARYLTPYKLPTELRKQLLTRESPEDFLTLLDQIEPEIGMNQISSS
jgi:tRNA-dihydrouridine synthase